MNRALLTGMVVLFGCATPRGVLLGSVSLFSGRAVDRAVRLTPASGGEIREVRSDSRGEFRFERLPAGHYVVSAVVTSGERLAQTKLAQARVELPRDAIRSTELFLFLEGEGGTVSGFAIDQFERPVMGATICATCPGGRTACDETDSLGHFSTEWLPAATCTLSEQRWGKGQKIMPGQAEVRLVLRRDLKITGSVVGEDGRSLPDYRVGEKAFRRGTFTVDLPKSGLLEIAARDLATEVVDVKSPRDDLTLPPVTLTKGTSVRGVVLDAKTGERVEGAVIQLPASVHRNRYPEVHWCGNCQRARIKNRLPVVTSGADGRFDFAHLAASQSKLVVTRDGYLDQPVELDGSNEVTVKLQRGGLIHGRVLDASGRGLKDVTVYVPRDRRLMTHTRGDGSFELSGLELRAYRLAVELPDEARGFDNARYEAMVVAKLAPGATIVMRERRGTTDVVIDRGEFDVDLRLIPGEAVLPASLEELDEILDVSYRCVPLGLCEFAEIPAGRHTLLSREVTEEGVTVSAQPVNVTGNRVEAKWAPLSSRVYRSR